MCVVPTVLGALFSSVETVDRFLSLQSAFISSTLRQDETTKQGKGNRSLPEKRTGEGGGSFTVSVVWNWYKKIGLYGE